MTDYAYAAGEWTALAHEGRAALLDPAIDVAAVRQIWEAMAEGAPLESWLEVLAGNGLAALPGFGLVEPGPDGVRVVVRGEVVALVEDYDVSAGGMRTWREHVAPADTGVVLQIEAAEVAYPLIGGIVLAAALQVGDRPEPATEDDAQEPAAGEHVDGGAAAAGVVAGAGLASGDVSAADEGEQAPQEAEQAAADGDLADGEQGDGELHDDEQGDGEQDDDEQDAAEEYGIGQVDPDQDVAGPDDAGPDDAGPDDAGQDVSGQDDAEETAAPEQGAAPVEAAAEPWQGAPVGGGEPAEAAGAGEQAWAEQAQDVQMENLPDGAEAAGEPPLGPAGQSDPWAAPVQAPAPSQWGPPPAYEAGVPGAGVPAVAEQGEEQAGQSPHEGDHDGYTMAASDLPARTEEAVDTTLAPAQEDLGGGEEQVVAPVPTLSLSTGQQVELDRPVLIGRAPESSRFGFGDTPRLVTVPSPQQDISRTHVEIKLEGDHVLVTDLRSTNGTVVVLPGSPPRRLHPGESVPVPASTVIDLGDGVTVVVTAPEDGPQQAY